MSQPQEFPTPLKLILLSTVMLLIILVPMFGYYQNVVAPTLNPPNGGCPSGETPKNGICAVNDPYTLIWNGTVTGAGSTTTGNTLWYSNTNVPTSTPTRSAVPTKYVECISDPGPAVSRTLVSFSISIKKIGSPTGTFIGRYWDGTPAAGLEPSHSCAPNNLGWTDSLTPAFDLSTVPTSYTTYTFKFNIIVPAGKPFAVGFWDTCTSCDLSNYVAAGVSATAPTGQNASSFESITGWDCDVPAGCPTTNDFQFEMDYGVACPLGFSCMNSGLSLNNYATLIANATFPAVMLTTSTITTSTAASKELLFYETWGNSTNILASKPFAWYLTINSTLPQTQNYNPLTDPNTAMVVIVYPSASGNNKYYIYQQKDSGAAVLTASGQSQNPYPTCPQTATLYICSNSAVSTEGSTNFLSITALLNYTGSGSNTGGAGAGTPNANSLLCSNNTPANLNSGFCSTPGSPQSNTPCSSPSAGICTTNTFPFLNVQGQYYLGFWSNASQTGNILFGTSNTGNVDKRANGVYYWIPNPSCPPTCAQTDTCGFFGWLGKTFSGAVNTVF